MVDELYALMIVCCWGGWLYCIAHGALNNMSGGRVVMRSFVFVDCCLYVMRCGWCVMLLCLSR